MSKAAIRLEKSRQASRAMLEALGIASTVVSGRKKSILRSGTNEPFPDLPLRIKTLRMEKQLTLTRMAELVGITKGFLSQIESGAKGPSIPTLLKVANVLGTPISYFFDIEPEKKLAFSIVRPDERRLFRRNGSDWDYHFQALATSKAGRMMEPLITRPPQSPPPEPFVHAGEEMIFVIRGQVRLELGKEVFTLNAGDCAYYDGAVPHRSSSIGKRRAVAILVIASNGGRPLPAE